MKRYTSRIRFFSSKNKIIIIMITKIVLWIIWLFILNIILYFFIPPYNSFIKNLKYLNNNQSNNIYIPEEKNIEKYNWESFLEKNIINDIDTQTDNTNNDLDVIDIIKDENDFNQIQKDSKNKDYSQILNYFSKYNLSKKTYDPDYKMFYLTSEYFQEYITYSWSWIDLYIYNNDSFLNIYNFFDEIKDDIWVNINKTNTFWNNSFFINKINKDWRIRLIIKYSYILIWLNIDKSYYEDIKKILNNF